MKDYMSLVLFSSFDVFENKGYKINQQVSRRQQTVPTSRYCRGSGASRSLRSEGRMTLMHGYRGCV